MPYNTRRKSLSLPSLGIHVPVSNAARAAAAAAAASAKSSGRSSSSSTSSAARSQSPDSHPSKRLKRSHADPHPIAIETTPPPSPPPAPGAEMSAPSSPPRVDLEGINDDIVEAVITQLQATGNRPHLIKDLALVLSQSLTSVQNSANQCAIISSRLASYMKRTSWSALAPCPLAKELETVHPRRTYYFLTTYPRQPLPESGAIQPLSHPTPQQPSHSAVITPSVSLTDDSGSDDVEERRRQLSPSPEIDLPPPDFDDAQMDDAMASPVGSQPKYQMRYYGDMRHDLPPLEKDEREFTQTADGLQKRKLNHELSLPDIPERTTVEYSMRDSDVWFGDSTFSALLTSPAMRPSMGGLAGRKEDETDNWLKLSKLYEWDTKGAESIEIDELEGLLDDC